MTNKTAKHVSAVVLFRFGLFADESQALSKKKLGPDLHVRMRNMVWADHCSKWADLSDSGSLWMKTDEKRKIAHSNTAQ